MSLDPNILFLEFALGGVGSVLLIYGWKQRRVPQLVAGALFGVYPYFVSTAIEMLVVAAMIVAGLWWALRMGY